MNLVFHYHVPAILKDGAVKMPAYLGLFIDSIAPYFTEVNCLLYQPTGAEKDMMDYTIENANVSLCEIGEKSSIPRRYLNYRPVVAKIKQLQSSNDVILIRASTPLVPFIKRHWNKPTVMMLVSDATLGLDNLPQPGWRRSLIKKWADWYAHQELLLAEKSLTIVNSQMLYDSLREKVKLLHLLQTTTLRLKDFREREDTCQNDRVRLIFSGRITRIKGILDIIDAIQILRSEGFNLYFDLVGMLDEKGNFLKEMNDYAESRCLNEYIQYIGYRTAGEKLLDEYRSADVFVIASQASSEGFPRTLWEAMASSVPIVATAVSSIPAFTKGAVELAKPKNPSDFADKLREVLTNSLRRKEMIDKGRLLARDNTLEVRGEELSNLIKNYVQ